MIVSFKELGWKWYIDQECTIELDENYTLPFAPGSENSLFLCNTGTGLNSSGKVERNRIALTKNPFIVDMAVVERNRLNISIFDKSDITSNSVNVCETIAIYNGSFSIDDIKSSNLSKKRYIGPSGYYNSTSEANNAGLVSLFEFNGSNREMSLSGGPDEVMIKGNIITEQGINTMSIVTGNMNAEMSLNRSFNDSFAISSRIKIKHLGSFSIFKIGDGIELKYVYATNKIELNITDHFGENIHNYNSKNINFGNDYFDISLIIDDKKIIVLLDENEIINENISYEILDLKDFKRANDYLDLCGLYITKTLGDIGGHAFYYYTLNGGARFSDKELKLIYNLDSDYSYANTDYRFPSISYRIFSAGYSVSLSSGIFKIMSNSYYTSPGVYHPRGTYYLDPNTKYEFKYKVKDIVPNEIPEMSPFIFISKEEKMKISKEFISIDDM